MSTSRAKVPQPLKLGQNRVQGELSNSSAPGYTPVRLPSSYTDGNPFDDFIFKGFEPNSFSPLATPPILNTPPIGSNFPSIGKGPFSVSSLMSVKPSKSPPPTANDPAAAAAAAAAVKKEPASAVNVPDNSSAHHGLHLLASAKQSPVQSPVQEKPPEVKSGKMELPSLPGNYQGLSDVKAESESPGTSATPPKRKRRVMKDMTPTERRNIYLDRNKVAASKCRQRKKEWLNNTQTRAEMLQQITSDLQSQLTRLKAEQLMLLEYLTLHRNCGTDNIGHFLDNRVEWEKDLLAFQPIEVPELSQLMGSGSGSGNWAIEENGSDGEAKGDDSDLEQ